MSSNINEARMLKHHFSFYFSSSPGLFSYLSMVPTHLSQMEIKFRQQWDLTEVNYKFSLSAEWNESKGKHLFALFDRKRPERNKIYILPTWKLSEAEQLGLKFSQVIMIHHHLQDISWFGPCFLHSLISYHTLINLSWPQWNPSWSLLSLNKSRLCPVWTDSFSCLPQRGYHLETALVTKWGAPIYYCLSL